MVPLLGVTRSYITIINNYLQQGVPKRIFGLKVITKNGSYRAKFSHKHDSGMLDPA